MNKVQREALISELRDIYDAYQAQKKAREDIVRARLEKELSEAHGSALIELSKAVHDYHRKGLPKTALREATRKYGNAEEFAKIWDAFTPELALPAPRSHYELIDWDDSDDAMNRIGAQRPMLWYTDSSGALLPEPIHFYAFTSNGRAIPSLHKSTGWMDVLSTEEAQWIAKDVVLSLFTTGVFTPYDDYEALYGPSGAL